MVRRDSLSGLPRLGGDDQRHWRTVIVAKRHNYNNTIVEVGDTRALVCS